jgi:hypothetical protein
LDGGMEELELRALVFRKGKDARFGRPDLRHWDL